MFLKRKLWISIYDNTLTLPEWYINGNQSINIYIYVYIYISLYLSIYLSIYLSEYVPLYCYFMKYHHVWWFSHVKPQNFPQHDDAWTNASPRCMASGHGFPVVAGKITIWWNDIHSLPWRGIPPFLPGYLLHSHGKSLFLRTVKPR